MINKILLNQNVFEAALDRIRFIFDEFEEVIASISGGKDSTVIFNLALMVAKEKNRLPLKVLFVDQEGEWDVVINHVREIMNMPDVKPYWLQVPIKLFNATSTEQNWLMCWGEGEKWLRKKEDIAIKVNKYKTNRFKKMFDRFLGVEFKNKKVCYLAGVRTQESPSRFAALTGSPTYKWITWGKKFSPAREHYSFYPIYDWTLVDVWKAISTNNWSYCRLYDYMFQYGIPINNMRVSNVHHESAVQSLYFMQEIEPDNWNRLVERLKGINTAGMIKKEAFNIKRLPFMFDSWKQYRDYLLENLIADDEIKQKFVEKFDKMDKIYDLILHKDEFYIKQINTILLNDYHFTVMQTFECRSDIYLYRKWRTGKTKISEIEGDTAKKYIPKNKGDRCNEPVKK